MADRITKTCTVRYKVSYTKKHANMHLLNSYSEILANIHLQYVASTTSPHVHLCNEFNSYTPETYVTSNDVRNFCLAAFGDVRRTGNSAMN